ncbi:MAG: sulfite exporter TauE/SafE family protein [Proteobacteria bacterium]|nr:sulfite exporter TauE/SafE family protein [Pseudomonadota bacterium]
MDHLNNLSTYSPWLIPLVFLFFGITSSLHCVGMCGPLSLLAAHGSKSSWLYQTGRLTGYLSIGTLLSFVGKETLNLLLVKIGIWFWYWLVVVISISLIAFVFAKFKISAPRILDSISKKMMSAAIKQKNQSIKSFAIGVSSVFLPCGVLYLALISLVALSSPLLTIFGIVFFWMGTLPLLHFGLPQLKKFLDRLSIKVSQLNAFIIIVLCVLVLMSRYPHIVQDIIHHCH